ncbi:nicotinate-nicotinamide nucleotide adenylyltransferase [Blattabacterium cuenoti]|uniref:nicotinate-nicotinamide nucleotide adenylyltransferase n=1 Tax=Blattabacterium cuenoti TaxID=1653831 RepID=UPI001EEA8593
MNYEHRIKMVEIAVSDYENIRVLDIEHGNYPSYTIHTLNNIETKYPGYKFFIILGVDTYSSIKKWKDYKIIIRKYDMIVYPRIGCFDHPIFNIEKIAFLKAPIIEISSSFIRNNIQKGKNMKYLLHIKVWNYMNKYNLYR